jgi:hypothetical protein
MSDDDEGEYNTITHLETGRGVKLLYSKSKVCTPDARPYTPTFKGDIMLTTSLGCGILGLHPSHTLRKG